ncbi:MAG: FAD-dependent monooxygenase, partial [Gammaproteobacteria bacterium]|nr:FAD-dependent monooxygenase [Gammaproteobacteria bacterium]
MMYNALIIGGGPAGATVAWLLARAGWSVALLEKSTFPRRKVCGEFISATTLPLLRALDIEATFLEMAGPPVRNVGVYAGKHMLVAPMPVNYDTGKRWGRALGREYLDTLLLDGARQAGVDVKQPYAATRLVRENKEFICYASAPNAIKDIELRARIVIAAHGSWEPGLLPTQIPKQSLKPTDLFALKAHFVRVDLPAGVMPLLAFPGGYGGMVHTDH